MKYRLKQNLPPTKSRNPLMVSLALMIAGAFHHPASAQSPVPVAIAEVDADILRKAETMSAEELQELWQLYVRKKDKVMAAKIEALISPSEVDDSDGKNSEQPAIAESAPVSEPPELKQAQALIDGGKALEAVAILERLQVKNDPKAGISYVLELASALDEAGQNDRAIVAYQQVLTDGNSSEEDRQEAQDRLEELTFSAMLAKADQALDDNHTQPAEALLKSLSSTDATKPEVQILAARLKLQTGEVEAGESALAALAKDEKLAGDVREDARVTLENSHVSRLLKEGTVATEAGDHQLALRLSQELYSIAPLRTEVLHFRAKALLTNHEAPAALRLLEGHSAVADPSAAGDHLHLMAQALERTGAWERAVSSYRTLGADAKFSVVERGDFLSSADELAALGSPGFTGQWSYTDAQEGTWSSFHATAQTGALMQHGVQFLAEGYWDEISPVAGRWSERAEEEQIEGTVAVRAQLREQYFFQTWVTEHADGVGTGAALGRMPVAGPGYQLRYDYQRRATDSLFLRSLNGRQNRVSASLETEMGAGFSFNAQGFWREVTVDGTSLGEGGGLEISLSKTLLKETSHCPSMAIAYLGEVSKFDAKSSTGVFRALGLAASEDPLRLSELIDPRINRQEMQLSAHRYWTPNLETTFEGALGYEFEDKQTVWRVGLQSAYRLTSNARLTLQLDYDSSGQAANAGSSVTSLVLGVAVDF